MDVPFHSPTSSRGWFARAAWVLVLLVSRAHAVDGAFDPTFGDNGHAYLLWNSAPSGQPITDYAYASTVQTDGRVVMVGTISENDIYGGNRSIGVARLLPNGNFDTTFGDPITPGRMVIHSNAFSSLAAYGVALQSDGKIVVVGQEFRLVGGSYMSAWRLMANGILDGSYGGGGAAALERAAEVGPDDRAWAVVIGDEANGIPRDYALVAGSVRDSSGDGVRHGAVFALDETGTHWQAGDHTDADGLRYTRVETSSGGVAVDNELYAFGACSEEGIARCYGAGYAIAGAPPRAIGILVTMAYPEFVQEFFTSYSFDPATVNSTPSVPTSVARDRRTGRVWVGGTVRPLGGTADRMGVAAFLPSGPLDISVLGGHGRAMVDFSVPPTFEGHAQANGIAVQRDGRIVLGGWFYWNTSSDDARLAAVRIDAQGSVDPSFGDFSASLPGVQAGQVPINGLRAETRGMSLNFAAGEGLMLAGYTHDYSVPGAWYYTVFKLTGDLIFADGFD